MEQTEKKLDSNTLIIVITILVAALIVAGSIFLGNRGGSNGPVQTGSGSGLEIGESAVIGNADAPVTIVEFLDFQCPFCEKFFTEVEPILYEKYIQTGKAKMAFKTLTFIDSFDRNQDPQESLLAAQAAECAKEQGKFGPMHDAIYTAERNESASGKNPENSGNLTEAFFTATAQSLELDMDAYASCVASERIERILQGYQNDAEAAMGARISTPTIFIDGVKVANPFDLAEYERLIQ